MAVNAEEIIQLVFIAMWGKSIDRGTDIFLGSDISAAGL